MSKTKILFKDGTERIWKETSIAEEFERSVASGKIIIEYNDALLFINLDNVSMIEAYK